MGPDGVEHTAPSTFRTKTDAEVWLSRIEAQISEGRWLDPFAGRITVGEWGRRWLAAALPGLKRKTQASYESLWRLLIEPRFGRMQVSAVRPIMVAEWVSGMNARLSASRVRQAYGLLKQIMDAAVNNDLIGVTPCRGAKLPKLPASDPHILTRKQVALIAANTRAPYDLLIWIIAYSGLRVGEVFALRRRHIDLAAGVLKVESNLMEIGGRKYFDTPKNHQIRTITLPKFLVRTLGKHLESNVPDDQDAMLFLTYRGTLMRYNSWRVTHFDPAVQAASLEHVTPKDLRATHGTWVADRHGVMAAAKRLGHSNASVTTRHYVRAVETRDAKVADDLDRPDDDEDPQ
jgi:integrase